ncbi:hypothetical protein, partial [Mycobacteroides abscessus]|uniref:hypothetical protein n=1 Tax=Mycobacteroides abscessus TaxID=36809 RepID=UPI000B33E4EB
EFDGWCVWVSECWGCTIGAGWRRSGGAERAASGCGRISGTSWAGGDTDDVTGTCARWPFAAV